MTNYGSGYSSMPTVLFSGGTGILNNLTPVLASGTAQLSTYVKSLTGFFDLSTGDLNGLVSYRDSSFISNGSYSKAGHSLSDSSNINIEVSYTPSFDENILVAKLTLSGVIYNRIKIMPSYSSLLKAYFLSGTDVFLYVASWNGSKKGLGGVNNPLLSAAVVRHLGQETANLFNNDFINYDQGVILCMNQASELNKFFSTTTPNAPNQSQGNVGVFVSISDFLRFTCVRMPEEFIKQKNNLTSQYKYGEKLRVVASLENIDTSPGSKVIQAPNGASSAPSVVPRTKRQVIIYRDSNMKGRGVKGQSSGGTGASIGVWS
jgi:hypothetical protein